MAITNNFGSGVSGGNYSPNTYTELGSMIGKVAHQVIREVEAKNPMSVFDKMPVANGDTIEQAIVKLVEAQGYDSTGAGAITRDTSVKLAVQYFKNWQRHTYKTTVDVPMIRKALVDGKGASDISSKLVSVLGQSALNDKFQSLKALLVWGTTTASWTDQINSVIVGQTPVPVDTSGNQDNKAILKKIKNLVSQMKFVNTSCNRLGINRATMEEDIYIIMPYTLRNSLDVDELAGVFNLEKTDLKARIIEIDDTTHNYVYIVDKNCILAYTRLYEMADQKNADGLFWNYFLHKEDLFGISALFDSVFFEYNTARA